MADPLNRRPLNSRSTKWAQFITRRLAAAQITPNQISAASLVFATLAGLSFAGVAWSEGVLRVVLLVAAGVLVQLRLLCNLFDGMVAIEAGQGAPTGPFWNEVPDRPADAVILIGVGIGAGAATLGWAAAALAIGVAYLRAFGSSLGHEADFSGPMAKQHRMAAVTIASAAAAILSPWIDAMLILHIALWCVVAGAGVTLIRRARTLHAKLSRGG
ncbi:CDP-alcohol phosphatidyltransferase family protein [Roseobacter sp.]|uniref:CDP-alcohol phosphatidyltransferase family protein n=1 Tax=Roseobacter sp. TaxID=1907202 RepID=UPI0032972D07